MSEDASAIAALAALSDASVPHTFLHYLYFPSSRLAASIAEELRSQGFRTEERLGADGVSWLVLARHEATPSEDFIFSIRRNMETLVARVGGEYDGWEVEVIREERF